MSRGASSIGSGGGGTIYEYRVAALDLVGLLCGVQVPGLDVVPDSVSLQKANDFPLDDVVVLNRQGSYELVVQRQVKRTLEVMSSSGPWRKTMAQCLASLDSFGDEIDADRHRLGLTASGPIAGLETLRDLAASAAAQKSVADFLQELPRLGQSYHRVWKHLTQTVSDLLAESKVTAAEQELVHCSAYRIARRLVVQIEPTEQISPRYPALCAALQERVLQADTRVDAGGVFRMVEELAQEWGPRGGAIDAAMLRNRLRARGVALRGDRQARSAVVFRPQVELTRPETHTQAAQVQALSSHTGRSIRSDVIGELKPSDALRLEVHPAVDADVASGALTALPPYIGRPHGVDGRLRRMVAQSVNGSRLVMVVGGSSTGKTRACWEAVRAELPTWRIVHPLAPDRPAALLRALQADVLEPRTVLWLNEAQLYFLVKDYTSQVSSALQDLLTDPQRGPVLVLGTVWPTYWNHLAEGDELHDEMGAVHQLADLALTITMPPAFNARELADAASLVASDPRLKLARSRAVSGRITQFLAGAPHLVRRYEQSDGAARAILHAAMDARRCGHGPLLTEEFLMTAAEGYIDEATWHTLDEGWFASSLDELLKPRRKLPGPLTRYRPRPGESSPGSALYQLADILHEKSRTTRKRKPPAPSLWAAAAAHSRTDADMRELAEAARTHQAVECEVLYLRAASGGDVSLLTWFIRRLIGLGQFRRAEALIEERCLSGLLLGELSAAVGHSGQYGDSERLARRAFAVSGDRTGHRRLAHHLLNLGMRRDAARQYLWAADHGDPSASRWLVGYYEAQGDRVTSERLARAALTQHGSPAALLALAQSRVAGGEGTEAARLSQIIADHGHADLLVAHARERADHRDHAAALCFYDAAATVEHPKALERMSWRSDGQGNHRRAEDLAHAAAARGNSHALHSLANLRFFKGYVQDAVRLNRAAAQAGSLSAREWLARRGLPA
ncbi:hypothetical protein [Streptomyces sp. NBC_00687]|uniref:hypothetical protein n=1 Tax=Streptomyces sp. NBC_00687 TaxID=2975807 RepID=UPI00224EDA09|nr:hypothetical protein [Streptomyces sp. NBC_00687]MCX4920215.1 hypothetical protein [Streptomyces sp. NBC_00687]